MTELKPTSIQFGNPDGSWTDLTPYVKSIDLSSAHVPYKPEVWDSFTQDLELGTFTVSLDAKNDPFAPLWEWAKRRRRRMRNLHSSYRSRQLSRRRRNR